MSTTQRRSVTAGHTGFTYQPRSATAVSDRLNKYKSGSKDSFLDSGVATFTPKEGDNWIRILPPTWENAQHYALELYIHYEVGPDNNSYLCSRKMKGEPCGLCNEYERAKSSGAQEYARALESVMRLAAWIINRDDEKSGVQMWMYSPKIDQEILLQSQDRRTGEVLMIDNPNDGFDVEFTRTGKALKTKYSGFKLARQPSSVSKTHVDFVVQNPIPAMLKYYSLEHIMAAFGSPPDENASQRPSEQSLPDGDAQGKFETEVPYEAPAQTAHAASVLRPGADGASNSAVLSGRTSSIAPQPSNTPKSVETTATGNAARRRPVTPPPPKGPDFSGMDVNALLDWADAHNIVVPDNVPDEGISEFLTQEAVAKKITE